MLDSSLDLVHFQRIVEARSTTLRAAQGDADLADAALRQTEIFQNPSLDATWGTIPLGDTNPANLAEPFLNVPNYSIGLSYTVLLGKRGPNQERARYELDAARSSYRRQRRLEALGLAGIAGRIAALQLRRDGMVELIAQVKEQLELTKSRRDAAFAAPLDVDRMEIELQRSEQQLKSADSDIDEALAACAALAGSSCARFASAEEARHFLDRWIDQPPSLEVSDRRADLNALADHRAAALAEQRLAENAAIPDPTLRLAYTHDRFVASGNQQNSLTFSVALPLPVFDHGQALSQGAAAKVSAYSEQRDRLLAAARARIPALADRLEQQRARKNSLVSEALPRADRVLSDLHKAAESRLIPLTDLIQARRSVSDLLLELADSYSDAFVAALELLAETGGEQPAGLDGTSTSTSTVKENE
ncbi:MAG: TolC family protein [Myxococcota bacterium]